MKDGNYCDGAIWGFPKMSGALLGVHTIRIIVFGGLYWGSHNFGKLPYRVYRVYVHKACSSWYVGMGFEYVSAWRLGGVNI